MRSRPSWLSVVVSFAVLTSLSACNQPEGSGGGNPPGNVSDASPVLPPRPPIPTDPYDNAGNYAVLKWMALQSVKTLSRGVDGYTYWNGSPVYLEPESSDRMGVVRGALREFADVDRPPGNSYFGDGFYAATDPVASKRYGSLSNEWRLIKTRFKAGSRFLDLRGPVPRQKMPTQFGDVLVDGCWAATVLDLFQANENRPCKVLMRKLISDLDLGFFAYAWQGYNFTGCVHEQNSDGDTIGTAFVLTNESAIDYSLSRLLSAVLPAAPDAGSFDRSLIKSVVRYGVPLIDEHTPYATSVSQIQDLSEAEVRDYTQAHYFGCNPGRYPEDRILTKLAR